MQDITEKQIAEWKEELIRQVQTRDNAQKELDSANININALQGGVQFGELLLKKNESSDQQLDISAFYEKSRRFFDQMGPNIRYLAMVKQGIKALKQYAYVWRKHGCYKYRPFPITSEKIEWLDEESVKKLSGTFDLKFITKLGEINREAFLLQQKITRLLQLF